jgi:endonuclease/exonuclease/phosphatase family metal-dependent hydrolase
MTNDRASVVRVMTWNIHGGVGSDRCCDLDRIIALAQRHDPDIIALQEVDSRRVSSNPEPAFEALANALGEHVAEARLVTAPDGDYGHAVISRWPLSDVVRHDVSVRRREPRAAIEATIATPFGALHVVAAHLGLGFAERRRQAKHLADVARSGPARAILLGDFNDWTNRGSVQRTLKDLMPGRTDHKTFPARLPLLALDRIYVRPAELLVRSWTDAAARAASDHLPVIADLDLSVAPEDMMEEIRVAAK